MAAAFLIAFASAVAVLAICAGPTRRVIRVIAVAPLASASAYIERYMAWDESHSLMGPHRVREKDQRVAGTQPLKIHACELKLWSWCAMPILYLGIYGLASVIRQKIAWRCFWQMPHASFRPFRRNMLQHTHLRPTVDFPAADLPGQGGAGELVDFVLGFLLRQYLVILLLVLLGGWPGDPSRCHSSNLHC